MSENTNQIKETPTKFPLSTKISSAFITGFIFVLMWFGVICLFLIAVGSYWSQGGHFYEWEAWQVAIGIMVMGLCTLFLSAFTVKYGVKSYVYFRTFSAKGFFVIKNWDIIKELNEKIKELKKRNTRLYRVLLTYAKKKELKEQSGDVLGNRTIRKTNVLYKKASRCIPYNIKKGL